MPMKYHSIAGIDQKVCEVNLGTMTWGEQNTEEEAFAQLDMALEMGVNFIDTAELYPVPPNGTTCGRTERYIGNWLKARNNRDKVVIATKVAGPGAAHVKAHRTEPPAPVGDPCELTAEQIHTACDASLKRLQTSYIDIYQLHWPSRYAPLWGFSQFDPSKYKAGVSFEEQVQAMGDLIKAGKIKAWGLSNETAYGVTMMCETAKKLGVPLPVTIQNDYSLVDRKFEVDTAEACYHYGVKLLAYGPLAGGTLSGKHLAGKADPGSRHVKFPNFQARYHDTPTMKAAEKYAAVAKKHGISPTKLALGFCKSKWFMGATIIGATTLEQLKENIQAFDEELPQAVLDDIAAVHMECRNPNCRD
ncbi:unnamed protein product [Pedinophyceae sp. YPF-701]|nr:unnamed protein product [Pedinophyceae sp. YPF-701]